MSPCKNSYRYSYESYLRRHKPALLTHCFNKKNSRWYFSVASFLVYIKEIFSFTLGQF